MACAPRNGVWKGALLCLPFLLFGCLSHNFCWRVVLGSKYRLEGVKATHNTTEYSKRKWQRPLKAATHDIGGRG
ncbi:hypothetical protein V8C42DRAFT_316886 [Trichoderma barbatum]